MENKYLSIKFNNPMQLRDLCEEAIRREVPLTLSAGFNIWKDKPTKPDFVSRKETDIAIWVMDSKF